jgi:hypothetical protein
VGGARLDVDPIGRARGGQANIAAPAKGHRDRVGAKPASGKLTQQEKRRLSGLSPRARAKIEP